MKTIFDLCTPREDVVARRMRDEEFAAELASVVNNKAPAEYGEPKVFFRHTHPTRGLRTLLETACKRLSGSGGELNSVVRLDTQFGGGKTHGLIALVHAVRGMKGVSSPEEFIDPKFLPGGEIRVAALDGENSDPANGLRLEGDLLARSLWGEMAYRLAGREGFERVRRSDETHVAPGTNTIVELFGGKPTLILIDEVAVYLRKVANVFPDAVNQFSAFAQSLFKAVATSPQVSLVITLAVRADDKTATDAYKVEQQIVMNAFEEAESVVGRKATQSLVSEGEAAAFDIDEVSEAELTPPVFPPCPLRPEDVRAVLRRQDLLPAGVECNELEPSTFSLRVPGQPEPARVTASPSIFDEHFESHQMLLHDSPIFRKLVEVSNAGDEEPESASPGSLAELLDDYSR